MKQMELINANPDAEFQFPPAFRGILKGFDSAQQLFLHREPNLRPHKSNVHGVHASFSAQSGAPMLTLVSAFQDLLSF
jgi:hypothetical protein